MEGSYRWRLSQAEIASLRTTRLIPTETWCPLDGPPPEYVPERWDGVHAGLRLCHAFKTLRALPLIIRGRRFRSGYWPQHEYDWVDLLAQQESDVQVKESVANEHNRSRVQPTATEISRMDEALTWAGRYLIDAEDRRVVQRVALLRSHEMDLEEIARRLRIGLHMLRERNRMALDMIAGGLRRDHAPVF